MSTTFTPVKVKERRIYERLADIQKKITKQKEDFYHEKALLKTNFMASKSIILTLIDQLAQKTHRECLNASNYKYDIERLKQSQIQLQKLQRVSHQVERFSPIKNLEPKNSYFQADFDSQQSDKNRISFDLEYSKDKEEEQHDNKENKENKENIRANGNFRKYKKEKKLNYQDLEKETYEIEQRLLKLRNRNMTTK